MRNLFICKTPYQIMVMTQIVLSKFNHDINDVLVADTIANYHELIDNMNDSHAFNTVDCFPSKSEFFKKRKKYYIIIGVADKFGLHIADFHLNMIYDRFFLCNLSMEETLIYRNLLRKNKNIEVYLFEDGYASYSKMYGDFFQNLYRNQSFADGISGIFRRIYFKVFYDIDGIYAFSPELFAWTPKFKIYEIPKIDSQNQEMLSIFDSIFGFVTAEPCYKKKYIFFEESYYADGKSINDLSVVQKLLEQISQKDLMVKIHPRNPENRFEKMGIDTNKNTSIPWEIIALHIDMSDKVLITIASGSALTSLINTGVAPRHVFMLMNCEEFCDECLTPTLPILKDIAVKYPEVISLPDRLEDAVFTKWERKEILE